MFRSWSFMRYNVWSTAQLAKVMRFSLPSSRFLRFHWGKLTRYTLVQWLRHFIMLPYQDVVTGSKHTNQTMNRMIAHYFCVCERYGILAAKFDQLLSLYCDSVKVKLQTGPGYWFLWESCEMWFPKFIDNFGIVSSKIHVKADTIFYPIEITWKKWNVQFVWHQCQSQRDVCIHYDVSLYQRIPRILSLEWVVTRRPYLLTSNWACSNASWQQKIGISVFFLT